MHRHTHPQSTLILICNVASYSICSSHPTRQQAAYLQRLLAAPSTNPNQFSVPVLSFLDNPPANTLPKLYGTLPTTLPWTLCLLAMPWGCPHSREPGENRVARPGLPLSSLQLTVTVSMYLSGLHLPRRSMQEAVGRNIAQGLKRPTPTSQQQSRQPRYPSRALQSVIIWTK